MSGVAAVRGRHGPSGRTSALPSGEAHGGLVAAAAIGTGGGRAVAHSVQDRVPLAVHGCRGGRRHPTLPPLRPALAPFWGRRRPCRWRGANASSAPSRVGRLLRGLRRARGRHPVLPLAQCWALATVLAPASAAFRAPELGAGTPRPVEVSGSRAAHSSPRSGRRAVLPLTQAGAAHGAATSRLRRQGLAAPAMAQLQARESTGAGAAGGPARRRRAGPGVE